MLVCDKCHTARQSRKALESQPVQWSGFETTLTTIYCPDCGGRNKGIFREYLTAFELVGELQEAKEKIEKVQEKLTDVVFELSFYQDAADMLHHKTVTGQPITPEEAAAVLQYAADLEGAIC